MVRRPRSAAKDFMSNKRDYYEVLGVDKGAGAGDIKSAYRKIAVKYHPDRNPDDAAAEEKFKEAAEAYSVLSDPEKRSHYDRFGHQAGAGGFGGFDPSVFGDFSDILGDLFGGLGGFGGRRRRTRGVPGADLRYELRVDFEQAVFGHEVEIRIPRLESCEKCSGSGSKDGDLRSCGTCGGQGQVRFSQGFFSVAQTCPDCQGEGRVVRNPCSECRGAGRVEQERNLEVKIPAGVDNDMLLRLRGEGEHGRLGGPPGDLDVVIRVRPHERFERHDFDVHEALALTYSQLVLGTTVELETLHGKDRLKIPAGTQPGHEFRLRGQGVPRLRSDGRGDHVGHAVLQVPKPKDLDEDQLELLHKLAELEGVDVHQGQGVMNKVKSLFN